MKEFNLKLQFAQQSKSVGKTKTIFYHTFLTNLDNYIFKPLRILLFYYQKVNEVSGIAYLSK